LLDLVFLEVETAAWPCHFAGLAVLGGSALRDTRCWVGWLAGLVGAEHGDNDIAAAAGQQMRAALWRLASVRSRS
jgi:hypothetical protein